MTRLALLILLFTSPAHGAIVYERFEQNGKIGIRDDQGQIVLPAAFDALGWSDGSFSLIGQITGYRQGERWGLLNLKKEFITKSEYESLTYSGGDRVIVSRQLNPHARKFGSLNLKGELTIPMWYDELIIHDLRAIVMIKNGPRYEYGLIDLNNRTILPLKYKRLMPLGTLRYAVQEFSGKTALCSEEGKWATGFELDSISAFRYGHAIIHKGWQQGVIDRTGEIKAEPRYREIQIDESGVARRRKADVWKLIDLQQRDLQRIEADELASAGTGYNRVTINGKSALVDAAFNALLPLKYDYLGPVVNRIVVARKDGAYGLVRVDGSEILPFVFDSLIVSGYRVRVRTKQAGMIRWDLYDTVGVRKTPTSYDWIGPYNGKFFPVARNGFHGGVGPLGQEQIACVYDSIVEVNDSYVAVRFKGKVGIITLEDRWKLMPQASPVRLLPAECYIEVLDTLRMVKDFEGQILYFTDQPLEIFADYLIERRSDGLVREINYQGQSVTRQPASIGSSEQVFRESEGLTAIRRDGKYGFVDSRGRLLIANRYEGAGDFKEGRAPVRLLGKWGYIDVHDQIVIQPTLDTRSSFERGIAIVQRSGKSGLMDRDGTLLLETRYDSIRRFGDDGFILYRESLAGLADENGRELIEPRFEQVTKAGREHVIVKQNEKFGLLTVDGLSVFPLRYDRLIYLPESGLFFVHQRTDWEPLALK